MRCSLYRALGLLLLSAASAGPAGAQDLAPFDPAGDYAYDLASTAATVVEVELDRGSFSWPSSAAAADSAFLEVRLTSSRRRAPVVTAESGGTSRGSRIRLSQTFEGKAVGRRYLDVSPFLQNNLAAGSVVQLAVEGTGLVGGRTRMFVYDNVDLSETRVLVIAPHPDDAEIAAFGLYRSTDADVVTVTAGDAGGHNFETLFPEPGEHYRIKGWIRVWDSITVPFYGGVRPGRARNLGYYDATLGQLWETRPEPVAPTLASVPEPGFYRRFNVDAQLRDRAFTSSWPALVADLRAELDRVDPTIVVAAHPLLDRHRDHQFATWALLEALADRSRPLELYLYTNHAVGNEAFPLGPRDHMTGLPPWSGGELYFSRLYSHALDGDGQRLKLVALEAMHDLRPFDSRDLDGPLPTRRSRRADRRFDYFRRAPRPNELFFVLTPQDVLELRRASPAGR